MRAVKVPMLALVLHACINGICHTECGVFEGGPSLAAWRRCNGWDLYVSSAIPFTTIAVPFATEGEQILGKGACKQQH